MTSKQKDIFYILLAIFFSFYSLLCGLLLQVAYISLPIFRYCASNILPFISSICRGLEKTPEDKKMIAYVVEDRNLGTLGRDIVFYASKRYPELETRRMDWMYARNSIFQYRSLPLPSVILVPVDQNTVDWFVYSPFFLLPQWPILRLRVKNCLYQLLVTDWVPETRVFEGLW